MNKFIYCPKCNCQYLPGEIFDPKYFLGQPTEIIRNTLGEILGYEGIEMTPNETFVCEECGHEFEVEAKINFSIVGSNKERDELEIHQITLF